MNVSINQTGLAEKTFELVNNTSSKIVNKLSEILGENFSNGTLSKLILIFVALAIIWVGSKITNKLAKIGMFVVGIIIIVGLLITLVN